MHSFPDVAALAPRLANLRLAQGGFGLGVETAAGLLDVTATAKAFGVPAPHDMDDLLHNARAAQLQALLDAVANVPAKAVLIAPEHAAFAPLVTRPEKIICVGFNYREHAKETGTPIPPAPPLFSKYNNALNHHGGTIQLPTRVARQFDYETELVIVIGQRCRDVEEADALSVVAGYATGNDFSARELQMRTSQFMAGKTADGFAPLGPWLVPANRVPDPNALRLTTRVNGEVRQDWTTRDMIYDCRKLIAYASGLMTLAPGDLIFTGTPQGVILGYPQPAEQRPWLRAGDVVESELEGLGALRFSLA